MTPLSKIQSESIDEAVARLVSRAARARGVTETDVLPRVQAALEKYVFRATPAAGRSDILAFVAEMRADDLCFVLACEKGDEAAWEELISTFDPAVKSAARKMSRDAAEAEDLAGSIWAELYGLRRGADGRTKSKLAYYSGRGSLAGWLRAVVTQLAIDEHRKQSKFVGVDENRELENLAEESANSASGSPVVRHTADPETLFIEKRSSDEVEAALRAAFEELDAEDRLILQLYYFDGLKLKDIAATFGYHEATASRKLSRLHAEIRRATERTLRERSGWTDAEIRGYLSDAAMKIGVSVEKLLAVAAIMAILQGYR